MHLKMFDKEVFSKTKQKRKREKEKTKKKDSVNKQQPIGMSTNVVEDHQDRL